MNFALLHLTPETPSIPQSFANLIDLIRTVPKLGA